MTALFTFLAMAVAFGLYREHRRAFLFLTGQLGYL